MLRPLGWFRSNGGRVAWLAFFALACQFVLTFGHVHFGNVSVISAALAISADAAKGSARAPSSPAQKAPTGLARDFCAVCNNISLASTLTLPVSPAAVPPISLVRDLRWSLVAIEIPSRDHFHFNPRGPPHA
jgi:hypothetical protein